MDFPKSVPGVGLVDGLFVDENQATGQAGSLIPSKWGNDVTAELIGVIEEAGLLPDEENKQQLRTAVRAIVDKVAPVASAADELAGTDNIKRMTPLRVVQAIERRIPADTTIYQYGRIGGLTLANNAGTPATDIDIAPGSARAASNTASLLLAATLTKRLQSAGAWAAGPGGNGLFAGLRAANTWYHVFLIRRDSDGAVDAGFDTSVTAENRPAGYGAYRRLSSIKTAANGEIIGFRNIGRRFVWKSPIRDAVMLNRAISGTEALTVSTPPGVRTLGDFHVASAGAAQWIYVRSPDSSAVAMAAVVDNIGSWQVGVGANTAGVDFLAFPAVSDTGLSSDVVLQWFSVDSVPDFAITTLGWEEF